MSNQSLTEIEISSLLRSSIPEIQKRLVERNKVQCITAEGMLQILRIEKTQKNRRGLREWLMIGIERDELPSEYFLNYADKLGAFKSAVQKFIRRSMAEQGVKAAKSLWRLGRAAGIERLKIIVVEETTATHLLELINNDTTEAQFLGVVKTLCECAKDKSSCPLAIRLDEDKSDFTPSSELLKSNLQNRTMLPVLAKHALAICKNGQHDELVNILGGSKIVKELIYRQKRGTAWGDDSALLVISAVRHSQNDYDGDVTLQFVEPNKVQPLRLSEVPWYSWDFHTMIGKKCEGQFLLRHPEVDKKELRKSWFMSESGKLAGKIRPSEWDNEPYDKTIWTRYGKEIQELVEDMMRRFQLEGYDLERGWA